MGFLPPTPITSRPGLKGGVSLGPTRNWVASNSGLESLP